MSTYYLIAIVAKGKPPIIKAVGADPRTNPERINVPSDLPAIKVSSVPAEQTQDLLSQYGKYADDKHVIICRVKDDGTAEAWKYRPH